MSCFVHKQVRIVGGGPVPIKEGSWMVSIQKGWVTQCSFLSKLPVHLEKVNVKFAGINVDTVGTILWKLYLNIVITQCVICTCTVAPCHFELAGHFLPKMLSSLYTVNAKCMM